MAVWWAVWRVGAFTTVAWLGSERESIKALYSGGVGATSRWQSGASQKKSCVLAVIVLASVCARHSEGRWLGKGRTQHLCEGNNLSAPPGRRRECHAFVSVATTVLFCVGSGRLTAWPCYFETSNMVIPFLSSHRMGARRFWAVLQRSRGSRVDLEDVRFPVMSVKRLGVARLRRQETDGRNNGRPGIGGVLILV